MIESKDMWKMSTSEKIVMQTCGCRTVLIQNVVPFSHGINCRHQLLRLRNYLCLASVARDTGICCRRLGSRHMVFRQYCEILVVRKRDPPKHQIAISAGLPLTNTMPQFSRAKSNFALTALQEQRSGGAFLRSSLRPPRSLKGLGNE